MLLFEEIPVIDVCCPACHDSLLYLVAMVLFLDAFIVPHLYTAFNIVYQHIAHVYRGVVNKQHSFDFAMFIFRPIWLLSYESSCSI